MSAELLTAMATLATALAAAAGGAVAWIWRQHQVLMARYEHWAAEAERREARCEWRLGISRRRELVHRHKIAEIGRAVPGIDVNGGYLGVLGALDREEREREIGEGAS